MQMNVMKISIEEGAKAFRVNGITFAKRHLVKTMAKDCDGDESKMLAKFLVIVPFLATAFQCSESASESVKYGAVKAKRMYQALNLNEDNIVPFMMVCLAQAGDLEIPQVGEGLREAGFYGENAKPFQQGEAGSNVVPFPRKPTLH